MNNSQSIGINTDYLLSLLLSYAYRGTSTKRTALLNAVQAVNTPQGGEDVEAKLEQWRRVVTYLPRFGITVPDYGIMVNAADKKVANFEANSKFALDKALYVRHNNIDAIKSDGAETFEAYVEHLVGLVRMAGGSMHKSNWTHACTAKGGGKDKGKASPKARAKSVDQGAGGAKIVQVPY